MRGVKIKFRMEECAKGMEQREQEYAATKDVQIKLRKEECAVGMEEKDYAELRDVQNKFRKVECALSMEQTSNDEAVMDAPHSSKSTLVAVRKINGILLLVDKVALINNKE